ncbi:MAG: hypothetical protein H7328_05110 [Bdellovibrio sp.]|nr:hypothetical protein [Bdellovibrio sp.]
MAIQKNVLIVATTMLTLTLSPALSWSQKIPVSVTAFSDKSGASNCRFGWDNYWSRYIGNGFQEMLITELKKSDKLALFERENIKEIYSQEHELVNSENDVSIKKKAFKKAKYTFVGAVTEFEYCSSEEGGSVNVGSVARAFGFSEAPDFRVGRTGSKAKLTVDVRVIDVTTGEVIKTVTTSGEVIDSEFKVDANMLDYKNTKNSPMGKAAREAISKAAHELIAVVN